MTYSLLELQETLRNIPIDGVKGVARGEHGKAAQLLGMDEIKRRAELRQEAMAQEGEQEMQNPPMVDQYLQAAESLQNAQMAPGPQGMAPPGMAPPMGPPGMGAPPMAGPPMPGPPMGGPPMAGPPMPAGVAGIPGPMPPGMGYQEGGEVGWGERIGGYAGEGYDWVKENPLLAAELAATGLMFVPGIGTVAGGAAKLGLAGLRGARTIIPAAARGLHAAKYNPVTAIGKARLPKVTAKADELLDARRMAGGDPGGTYMREVLKQPGRVYKPGSVGRAFGREEKILSDAEMVRKLGRGPVVGGLVGADVGYRMFGPETEADKLKSKKAEEDRRNSELSAASALTAEETFRLEEEAIAQSQARQLAQQQALAPDVGLERPAARNTEQERRQGLWEALMMGGLQLARTGSAAEAGIAGLGDFRGSMDRSAELRSATYAEDLARENMISRRIAAQAQMKNAMTGGGMTDNAIWRAAVANMAANTEWKMMRLDPATKDQADQMLMDEFNRLKSQLGSGGMGISGLSTIAGARSNPNRTVVETTTP